MNDQWMIRGAEFTNCNCAYGCPCQFNSPTTNGFCEAAVSVQIEEGHFNDTRLDGLCFVMLLQWPGEIAEGNGAFQVIIDEGATPEQREAIRKISTGESTEPGATHFAVFNSTMLTIHDALSASIDMSIDIEARQARTTIEGVVNSVGTPIVNPFSGKSDRKRIHLPHGFEYTYAEMASGTSSITSDIQMELSDSYGQFNILHMNQNGVIRD